MFQFPTFAHCMQCIKVEPWWVAPFGYLRINVYLPLPEAFRSLSRPSSPLRAKASSMCPYLLSFFFFCDVSLFLSNISCLLLLVVLLLPIRQCPLWWRITDSNRWPPACKAGALASWANPPYFRDNSEEVYLATKSFFQEPGKGRSLSISPST